jgi:hypothetical protein
MAVPAHEGNRHLMMKWSDAQLVFLLGPQLAAA